MNDMSGDPAAIERELNQTRARLGEHLDELTRRLSPGQLVDEALSYVRDGQGADFVRNLGAGVRDNPLPVTLTGLGLTWLAVATSMNGGHGSRQRALVPYGSDPYADTRDDVAQRARAAGEALSSAADETQDAFRARVAEARAGILGVKQQAQETTSAFADRVQQALDSAESRASRGWDRVSGSVRDASRQSAETAGQSFDQARDMASRAANDVASAVSENPLLLAAFGVAAGALLGALIPRTRQEDAYLGGAARQASDTVRQAGEQLWSAGSRAAEASARAGADEARDSLREAGNNPDRPE